MAKKIIIAIDGYSSCGKSTLARELAARLGYRYFDTGAMYRAVTLFLLNNNIDIRDTITIEKLLPEIEIEFEYDPVSGKQITYLNGENVEDKIREPNISSRVSPVSTLKPVRGYLVNQQRLMGAKKGIIMDGRDIGTVVFPEAELKIFLTANEDVRVQRRYDELVTSGKQTSREEVRENLLSRDYIDTHREESPLKQAKDARVLDNSFLSREEQLDLAAGWALEIINSLNI